MLTKWPARHRLPVEGGLMTQRSRPRLLGLLLAIVLISPVPLAAQHEQEWTVVTLARDGSWGVGTSEQYGPALASALRKCEATSGGQSDCGAEVTAVRQ